MKTAQLIEAVSAATNCPIGRVEVFVASRFGYYFREDVQRDGLDQTVADWKASRPSRAHRRRYGLAAGVDMLTAQVTAAWHERTSR